MDTRGAERATSDLRRCLEPVASTPLGRVVLRGAVLALAGLALWQLLDAVASARSPGRGAGDAVKGAVKGAAKGVALGVLGVLFVLAALRADPSRAGGLDAALRTPGRAPSGAVLLVLVGAGFAAHGVYSAARARYARR